METYYCLGLVNRTGMYCDGEPALTPQLTRLCRGNLIPRPCVPGNDDREEAMTEKKR